jgi:hypothetical protein
MAVKIDRSTCDTLFRDLVQAKLKSWNAERDLELLSQVEELEGLSDLLQNVSDTAACACDTEDGSDIPEECFEAFYEQYCECIDHMNKPQGDAQWN